MLLELKKAYETYPNVLTTKQTAEMLNVHPSTITRYVRDGLKAYRTRKVNVKVDSEKKGKGKSKAPFRFLKINVLEYMDSNSFNPY